MKTEVIHYKGVNKNGTFKSQLGAIYTERGIKYGDPCSCGCSKECWLTVNKGRDRKGNVDIISFTGNKKEIKEVYEILSHKFI
ncbi:hypothetical protein LCGC14_1641900 [marine sediment metagenome]|uniref:Uncharacterized protein n=1 Tax=marine sediment metagenome TaxID=412755 RepID=A0A0F9HZA4_9ZZZZ